MPPVWLQQLPVNVDAPDTKPLESVKQHESPAVVGAMVARRARKMEEEWIERSILRSI